MTPTPEQNAKRETPRCDAAEAELERWMAAEEDGTEPPSILDLARTLETELQQLRLAADGMRDAAKELLKKVGEVPRECWTPKYVAAVDGVMNAILAYRAAGEGQPSNPSNSLTDSRDTQG